MTILQNQASLGLFNAAGNQTRGLLVREGVPNATDTNLLFGHTTVTGALSMQNNAINNLADGVAPSEAVNRRQLDAVAAQASTGWGLSANGSATDTIAPGQTVNINNGVNTDVRYNAATNTLQVDVVDNPTFNGEVTANGGLRVDNHLTVRAGATVDMGGNRVRNVANGSDGTDAVNVNQLNQVADTPITFSGNTGSHATRLGETFNIVGGATTAGSYSGSNIRTVVTGNQVQIQMADAPVFSGQVSAQGGLLVNGGSTLNGGAVFNGGSTLNGGTVVNDSLRVGAGASVDMGGNRVQNVAAGTAGTDAVNLDQMQAGDAATLGSANAYADAGDARTLRAAQGYADAGDARTLQSANQYTDQRAAETLAAANQHTDAQVSALRKEAFAGIAQAAALVPMAPSGEGETTLNVGVAAYGGQTAIGVAVARQIGRVTLNGGIAASGGKRNLVRMGAGWRF